MTSNKIVSQCKRRQYSALLYISIVQVIGPSFHKTRKVLILSQFNEIEQLLNGPDPGINEDILFHSIYKSNLIFINQEI